MNTTKIADRCCYRKTMKALTHQQLEDELEAKILAGDITVEEAEMEWQDYMHRGEIPFMACMDGKERKEK